MKLNIKKFLSIRILTRILSLLLLLFIILMFKFINNDIYYVNGQVANGWYNDIGGGNTKSFFQNGIKYTGTLTENGIIKYLVNGTYANGIYNNILYDNGTESNGNKYINGIFYDNNKNLAQQWNNDGYDDFYFKDGKKFNGYANENNIKIYFVDGKYANGKFDNKLFKDGIISDGNTYIANKFYDNTKNLANGWQDDGSEWYFFENGEKFTGTATDSNGQKYFINGKYANGKFNDKYYKEGTAYDIPSEYKITQNIYIPHFNTYPYNTGCWLLSAASGLQSKGIQINPDQLYDALPKTDNPYTGIMGDPKITNYSAHNSYAACFPVALVPTLKTFLPTVEDFTGASIDDIKFELSQGNTVQIWLNYGNIFSIDGIDNLSSDYHSVLLTGYDEDGFYHIESVKHSAYIYLPFQGSTYDYNDYNKYNFDDIYNSFGKMAVVYR